MVFARKVEALVTIAVVSTTVLCITNVELKMSVRDVSRMASRVDKAAARASANDTGGYVLVLGDSRDWYAWSEWCVLRKYRVSRVCTDFPAFQTCSEYEHTDLVCMNRENVPIVVMWMMYGVALTQPYHYKYNTTHAIPNVPANSLERVKFLLELNQKLFSEAPALVTFASNAWDVERSKQVTDSWDVEKWLQNATTLISQLRLLGNDQIVLVTSQRVNNFPDDCDELNAAMEKLSQRVKLPLANVSACLNGLPNSYKLRDSLHPATIAGIHMVDCILSEASKAYGKSLLATFESICDK